MPRVQQLVLIGTLVAAGFACAPFASRPAQPTSSSAPGASPAAPKAAVTAAPSGQLVKVGEISYSDFGTRSLRGKIKQGVDAGDFYFKGTFLRGAPGQKIKLSLKNVGQEHHNFSLPAQEIDQDLPAKTDRFEVEVTVPTSGGLRFFCKFHTDRGMNGQLLTEDLAPQPLASARISWPESEL